MMGPSGDDCGIIPRLCDELWQRIGTNSDKFEVVTTMFEIYNEKVRDLLDVHNSNELRVREHPTKGPFVENLTQVAITSTAAMQSVLASGASARTIRSTRWNDTSSRSHTVCQVAVTRYGTLDGESQP